MNNGLNFYIKRYIYIYIYILLIAFHNTARAFPQHSRIFCLLFIFYIEQCACFRILPPTYLCNDQNFFQLSERAIIQFTGSFSSNWYQLSVISALQRFYFSVYRPLKGIVGRAVFYVKRIVFLANCYIHNDAHGLMSELRYISASAYTMSPQHRWNISVQEQNPLTSGAKVYQNIQLRHH